jgi:hypothetical protein
VILGGLALIQEVRPMKIVVRLLGVIVLALTSVGPASAALIGFEGVAPPGGALVPAVPYVEAGFTFTSSFGLAGVNGIFDSASTAHTNGTDIFGWCADGCGATQVITVTGPGSFAITSIDVSNLFAGSFVAGMSVGLKGNFSGGGSISTSLGVSSLWVTHALAGFTGLSSLEITAVDPLVGAQLADSAIDNLVLAVPEPTAFLLLGTGLLALGRRLRKAPR